MISLASRVSKAGAGGRASTGSRASAGSRASTGRSRLTTGTLAALLALGSAQFIVMAPAAQAAETQLSETGWVATSNTTSSAADAPANAIDGNASTRFSSDADQASGMFFQVNLGSSQSFNQIVL